MPSALIVLSGGMDSTLCLFWAIHQGFKPISTISFYYGQKHSIELGAARLVNQIAGQYTYNYGGYKIPYIQSSALARLPEITYSALVENASINDVSVDHPIASDLPASFVPGRNLLFLTMATISAYNKRINNIVTGVCQTDYSGYPDCRANTIKALNVALNLGLDRDIEIHTPLMYLTKADSLRMMLNWNPILRRTCHKALAHSHTCYNGEAIPCMKCPACKLRKQGFEKAGMKDPLIERIANEI